MPGPVLSKNGPFFWGWWGKVHMPQHPSLQAGSIRPRKTTKRVMANEHLKGAKATVTVLTELTPVNYNAHVFRFLLLPACSVLR